MKKITPRKNISLFKKGIEKINKSMKMKGFGCNTCICNMIEPYPKELLIILDKYNWKFREFTGCAKKLMHLMNFLVCQELS